jgi:hypothetical protein
MDVHLTQQQLLLNCSFIRTVKPTYLNKHSADFTDSVSASRQIRSSVIGMLRNLCTETLPDVVYGCM